MGVAREEGGRPLHPPVHPSPPSTVRHSPALSTFPASIICLNVSTTPTSLQAYTTTGTTDRHHNYGSATRTTTQQLPPELLLVYHYRSSSLPLQIFLSINCPHHLPLYHTAPYSYHKFYHVSPDFSVSHFHHSLPHYHTNTTSLPTLPPLKNIMFEGPNCYHYHQFYRSTQLVSP